MKLNNTYYVGNPLVFVKDDETVYWIDIKFFGINYNSFIRLDNNWL